jgi:DNA-binding CsgD family transcriptional regulator
MFLTMFLLPVGIRQALEHLKGKESRVFSSDANLVSVVQRIAQEQGRSEEEVLTKLANAGESQISTREEAEAKWDSLTDREQEVLALVCLGKRNYEIAEALGISNETVKTHLQHIFYKFKLRSKKELRLLLRGWDFADWWDYHQM